eukprot:CAMPEP_0113729810 /NCGR_PEP_ID=MMETSP0038_2-20120614/42783_1 /TAXON_ID=2898 /ORGANISM="Cryptomonas paramecium" /LENGTH=68 /DNA_ID=CAMNT_0000661747 /DNA_START=155 /DNA_END=361 /DNA_ORIENTATION=+ /assembly_acc=CAM_ASM_000170
MSSSVPTLQYPGSGFAPPMLYQYPAAPTYIPSQTVSVLPMSQGLSMPMQSVPYATNTISWGSQPLRLL